MVRPPRIFSLAMSFSARVKPCSMLISLSPIGPDRITRPTWTAPELAADALEVPPVLVEPVAAGAGEGEEEEEEEQAARSPAASPRTAMALPRRVSRRIVDWWLRVCVVLAGPSDIDMGVTPLISWVWSVRGN